MRSPMFLPCVALTLAATACGSSLPKAVAPPPTPAAMTQPTQQPPQAKNDHATQSNIRVAEDVKKACGLTNEEAYFAFDSSAIRPQDQRVLEKLALCFSNGPLKAHEMDLIGHTDPRGTDDYNMALGGRRADSVKQVMVSDGLADNRVQTTSRGEIDARGTNEATWALDRNVDVAMQH